jgi:hypothetical protein
MKKMSGLFEKTGSRLKQLDLPSIATAILDLPIPFSSVGVLGPHFYMSNDMVSLYNRMLMQIEQQLAYVTSYCSESGDYWCAGKIAKLEE